MENPRGLFMDGKAAIQRVCQRELARCLYPGLFLEYIQEDDENTLSER